MKVAELASLLGNAVAVAVAERDHSSALQRDKDVAVRRHGEMTWPGQAVSEDRRAKALGQGDAAVVRRAVDVGSWSLGSLAACQRRQQTGDKSESSNARIHRSEC